MRPIATLCPSPELCLRKDASFAVYVLWASVFGNAIKIAFSKKALHINELVASIHVTSKVVVPFLSAVFIKRLGVFRSAS
jgi:hypothetical protein